MTIKNERENQWKRNIIYCVMLRTRNSGLLGNCYQIRVGFINSEKDSMTFKSIHILITRTRGGFEGQPSNCLKFAKGFKKFENPLNFCINTKMFLLTPLTRTMISLIQWHNRRRRGGDWVSEYAPTLIGKKLKKT